MGNLIITYEREWLNEITEMSLLIEDCNKDFDTNDYLKELSKNWEEKNLNPWFYLVSVREQTEAEREQYNEQKRNLEY